MTNHAIAQDASIHAAETANTSYRDAVQRLRKAMSNADSNGIGVQVLQQEIYMADRDRLYWTQLATYHATMLVYEALPVDPR